MKIIKDLLSVAFVLSVSVNCFAATSDIECDIDTAMGTSLQTLNSTTATSISNSVGTAIQNAPTVKDASCIAILDQLDSLMRMRIPSVGGAMSGLLTKIRDMACNMADGYLRQIANRAQYSVGDPFGVVSIGVGGTAGPGGVQVEEYDVGAIVEQAAMGTVQGGGSVLQGQTNQVLNNIPSGPTNRTPRIEDTVNSTLNGALNGL